MDKAILDAVASGAYIMGKPVKELEAQLAEYVGVKHCLSCANGTDALTLALKAWGIGPGDAVFVPDFTHLPRLCRWKVRLRYLWMYVKRHSISMQQTSKGL